MPAPRLRIDAECKARIAAAIRTLSVLFNPYVMALRMRLTQPQFSELFHGHLTRFSFERLLLCVTRLGHDVHITLLPAPPVGYRRARIGRIVIIDKSDPDRVG
ncbi:MAG TPA: XRE family transcriptional regulator [Gemmatimonadaceae bacterium]